MLKFEVQTTTQAEEAICDILNEVFNTYPIVLHNIETDVICVSVYFNEGEINPNEAIREVEERLKLLNPIIESNAFKINISTVKYEDWAESWKRHFKPLRFGNSLLIKPQWSKVKPPSGAKVVILDPGLAFGTGQHATTKFCLQQIVKYRPKNKKQNSSFLDIGTGSGILAIAATKLGYSPVVAFDFDETAVEIAKKNAKRNRVAEKIYLFQQDVLKLDENPEQKYDLICANITADILIEARMKIVSRLNSEGRLVLAGILRTQFESVKQAYQECSLSLLRSKIENEWQSGLFISERD
ncbi:MAG: 50S ribosomal protein L11 methyltransferase [Verrucomicrobiia bacterium]